jgi:beta-glucanase (GH16 family)
MPAMTAPSLPRSAAPNNWLSTSTVGATLQGAADRYNSLTASAGNVTLIGGPLDDTFIVANTTDQVIETSAGGIDTVKTSGPGYTLPPNVENLTLLGAANATATGNAGNNLITANAGRDRITTGGGNDVLVAGTGADYFVITRQAGSITWISGLKTAGTTQDKIDLYGYGFQGFDSVKAAMTQVGGDVKIDLGGGQSLMIEGKSMADIGPTVIDVEPSLANLHLTFDEEFNTLSLNTGTTTSAAGTWKTTFSNGKHTLYSNYELEYYVDPDFTGGTAAPLGLQPFSIANGILTIAARPTSSANLPYLESHPYTSGLLTTETSFAQTYGYFEIRAEVPSGKGLWPAFWLLPADGTWSPELDVMEQIGSSNSFVSNGVRSKMPGGTSQHGTYVSANNSQAFHTYGMAWTPQNITFYYDGQQLYQVATPADLNKPMFMLVNLAVGGILPGSPDATTDWSAADFKIDYVRAYSYDPNAVAPPAVTLSNEMDPADLRSSFAPPATGLGSSTTYTATQMHIAGVDTKVTVSVAYDANNAMTVTNNGAWNAIKNATVRSAANGIVSVNNFVDAEITLGNGDSRVSVTGAKRGTIKVGNGNDTIRVAATSNSTTDNVMKIAAGDGDNAITFSGAANTAAQIVAGNGSNHVTVSGQAKATVITGGGNDDLADLSTGQLTMTGGGGKDLFEFLAGAHATVTDFQAGQDSIVLHGVSASQVQVVAGTGGTLINLGGGSSIQLAGVSLPSDAINLVYA